MQSLESLALALPLLVLAAACDGGGHGHHAPPPDPNLYEVEPNDTAATANGVGPIRPGNYFPIRGHVTDFGPDLFDGFAFVSDVPLEVEVVLTADRPAADLDFCVYDPFQGEFIGCFETPWNPEVGYVTVFEPGVEFHLVVSSFRGSSGYTLEVFGRELCCPGEALGRGAGERLRARAESGETRRAAFWSAYVPPAAVARNDAEPVAPLVRGVVVSIDPDSGAVEEHAYVRRGDRLVVVTE
jgi:hypothetical protein